jgi:hypothetical protein
MEVSKPQKSFKTIGTSTFVDDSIVFQKNEFRVEGISELCSDFIELLPLQKINGVLMRSFNRFFGGFPTNNTTSQYTKKTSGNSNKRIGILFTQAEEKELKEIYDGIKRHSIAGLIGILLGCLVIIRTQC